MLDYSLTSTTEKNRMVRNKFKTHQEEMTWESSPSWITRSFSTKSVLSATKEQAQETFTRDLKIEDVEIETPITKTTGKRLAGKKLAIIPILRAGLGMVSGLEMMIPSAKVGHIGMYRDPETLNPVEYYCKLPADIDKRDCFVVDPMLATGGSACDAIDALKKHGCHSIRFICIIAAPEGLKRLQEAHPDVDIVVGALDEKLNDHGYIVPGLGDAGDRIFGTK